MIRSLALLAVVAAVYSAFYQLQCSDSQCTQNCQKVVVPENTCVPVQGGGSAKVRCGTGYITEQVWESVSDCSGSPDITTRDQTGVCEASSGGGYYENVCTTMMELMVNNRTRALLKH